MSFIKDRLDQRDYNRYTNCENILLKAAGGDAYKAELQTVSNCCGCDVDQCKHFHP